MTQYLSVEDLLVLARDVEAGPVSDLGALSAAAHRPAATFYGRDAYATLTEKADALRDAIVTSRPMTEGNDRLAWLASAVFRELNGDSVTQF